MKDIRDKYEVVVGIEIHIQVNTESKAFCNDANTMSEIANINISPISLAHPGTMPKANRQQVDQAIKLGLAIGAEINANHFFDRKHYFYPDLTKGYQITQDSEPYCRKGSIPYFSEGILKNIDIHHIHMEEDAGKSMHADGGDTSWIDYNRAGVPLLEVVTEPDFRSGQEVFDFLAELQRIVQYFDISDANMEEGSFRCDCNVSIRLKGTETFGERCEIKNLNSKRFAKYAIEAEARRQAQIIDSGDSIERSTLLYNPDTDQTRPMRKKETAHDYRYFPDPDLSPMSITHAMIDHCQNAIGKLPSTFMQTFIEQGCGQAEAEALIQDRSVAIAFDLMLTSHGQGKLLSEIMLQKIIPYTSQHKLSVISFVENANIASLVNALSSPHLSKSAFIQHVMPQWLDNPSDDALDMAAQVGIMTSENQDFLDEYIAEVMKAFPEKISEYKKGKKGLIGFFMGQVKMKAGSSVDPKTLQSKLEKSLDS